MSCVVVIKRTDLAGRVYFTFVKKNFTIKDILVYHVCGVSVLFRRISGAYLIVDKGAGVTLYSEQATRWTGQGPNPDKGKMFLPSSKPVDGTWGALGLLLNVHRVSFPWVQRPEQVDQVLNYNPRGSRRRGRTKTRG